MTDRSVAIVDEPEICDSGSTVFHSRKRRSGSSTVAAQRIPFLGRVSRILIICLLLIFPLCFGGVHPPVYLSVYLAVLVVALLACFQGQAFPQLLERESFPVTALILKTILIFLGILLVNLFWHLLPTTPHPLFGKVRSLPEFAAFVESFISVVFCCAVFLLVRGQIARYGSSPFWFIRLAKLMVLIVGLTALSHWFYDNGKLFWTFEPETIAISERARWPFVNPNHLGSFLLQPFFLLLAGLALASAAIRGQNYSAKVGRRRGSKIVQLLLNPDLQRSLLDIFFTLLLCMVAFLAIIGSLSRGTWLGLSIGLLVFLSLLRRRRAATVARPERAGWLAGFSERFDRSDRSHGRRRGRPPSRHQDEFDLDRFMLRLAQFVRPALFLLAIVAVLFFLFGRGLELFESRIEYGLLHSKDDMRWQLYRDTWAMLRQNLFFGVGLGNWAQVYPAFMNYQLAGIDPGFLHSDPYQLLVEVGIVGIVPVVFLALALTWKVIHSGADHASRRGFLVVALYCGLLSVVIGSFLDFPFRVPAILALFFANLAVLAALLDDLASSAAAKGEVG